MKFLLIRNPLFQRLESTCLLIIYFTRSSRAYLCVIINPWSSSFPYSTRQTTKKISLVLFISKIFVKGDERTRNVVQIRLRGNQSIFNIIHSIERFNICIESNGRSNFHIEDDSRRWQTRERVCAFETSIDCIRPFLAIFFSSRSHKRLPSIWWSSYINRSNILRTRERERKKKSISRLFCLRHRNWIRIFLI